MGVAGLWEASYSESPGSDNSANSLQVLRPAGQVRSLTELAVTDGFLANPSHQRGFRIGIDASIWFFHAAYGKEGENPELRTLFFRCCRLLQAPLLPLFVFDGPKRPAIKRGKRVGGSAHWLTQGMKNIIEAFGFEWRMAPGEAEAELAYLNSIGVIDAVLSDDVDNFLFGATLVIRKCVLSCLVRSMFHADDTPIVRVAHSQGTAPIPSKTHKEKMTETMSSHTPPPQSFPLPPSPSPAQAQSS
jgi:Holliday junction resolvase YEN1